MTLPSISWPEAASESEIVSVRAEIIGTLTQHLEPAMCRHRVYALLPTPTLTPQAEARLLSAVNTEAAAEDPLRTVTLLRGRRCYVCGTLQSFAALVPPAFRFGPPELTLMAANSPHPSGGESSALGVFLIALLQGKTVASEGSAPAVRDSVGMHFDSGDLVEMF